MERRCARRRAGAPSPASHPPGTSVEVRDLFFNVPARRKFLRSETTEYQHILRMLERLALSRFRVGFSLAHNGRSIWTLPPARSPAERLARVAKLCGEEFAAHVIELAHETGTLRVSGWLALPTFSRSQSDLQFAFLNGRFVRDKLIAGAARLAYQDVLFNGRFCAYVLYLEMDPSLVDVNAHPQKLEVRFRESRSVHEFMFRTLERALARTRPTMESPGSAASAARTGGARASDASSPSQARFALPDRPASRGAIDAYRRFLAPSDDRAGAGAAFEASASVAVRETPHRAVAAGSTPSRRRMTRRRSASRWPSCTAYISYPRPPMAWCWSTCMPRTSASCMKA